DCIDRFFLGGINERARVYDQNVGLVGRGRDFHAALQYASEHDLGVHQIFGATKTDHADFCAHVSDDWICPRYSTVMSSSPAATGFPFFLICTTSRSETRNAIFRPRN